MPLEQARQPLSPHRALSPAGWSFGNSDSAAPSLFSFCPFYQPWWTRVEGACLGSRLGGALMEREVLDKEEMNQESILEDFLEEAKVPWGREIGSL